MKDNKLKNAAIVLGCLALVLGCNRQPSTAAEPIAVTVTNVVTVTREVMVTNLVEVTRELVVTNVVVEHREPERLLSSRKTAPYLCFGRNLNEAQLRELVSASSARVIESAPGAWALVEASDKAVKAASPLVQMTPLSARGKIAADAGERVRIVPVSSIDAAAVTAAVRALGGKVSQVITTGRPIVRAQMSHSTIIKLAERGDVRSIERDEP